jgi:hypothetical protein
MPVDITKLVHGQKIAVAGVFVGQAGHHDVARVEVHNAFTKAPHLICVAASDVVSAELAVGDRVRTLGGNKGRIAALTKGEACLVLEPTGFLSSPVLLAELTRIPEDADEPAPAKPAMRFKVGDRVDAGHLRVGEVTEVFSGVAAHLYRVRFPGFGYCVVAEAALSPAPAEERET